MLLIAYGTRPEYIKISPILKELKIPYKVLFTGQHTDIAPESSLSIDIVDGVNRLDSIVCSCLNNDEIFEGITHVLVQGDTTSVLAISLAAFHRGVKVIHLEAGLRTCDKLNPYPEEMNRRLVSSIADIHLCPTELNRSNLLKEHTKGMIHVVGNTVLDGIDRQNCRYGNEVLCTLHRRENHEHIEQWFEALSSIAGIHSDLTFTLPIHPNPNVQKYRDVLQNINVINPLNHDEMIDRLKQCRFVISDSGGLQEECSYLNKKIIVCRKVTERTETIGTHSVMCPTPDELSSCVGGLINDYEIDCECPYGDGTASEKIISILEKL